MTKTTQSKPAKHTKHLNGKHVIATRKDGTDSETGVYRTARYSNTFTLRRNGATFAFVKDNWTIYEIVEMEE